MNVCRIWTKLSINDETRIYYTSRHVKHVCLPLLLDAQRCWDVALGPLKQIPMNLFIMYMSGNTISIFPIMMVCMMAWRPIQALMSMSASEYPLLTFFSPQWESFYNPLLHGLFLPLFIILSSCAPAFKLLESSSQQWLQGLVYLIGNLLGAALAIYKCQSMGLLPTHSSDWLAFIEPPQVTPWTRNCHRQYSLLGYSKTPIIPAFP